MPVTLVEALVYWARDIEAMSGSPVVQLAVTDELLAALRAEGLGDPPTIAGVPVALSAATGAGGAAFREQVEIAGPDRVAVYVGDSIGFPLGLDPATPVVFVPVPPAVVEAPGALEMYNRLRWYGLGPGEAAAAVL